MALQQDSLWLLSISACSCAAIGVAATGLGTGTLTVPLAAGGLMALGLGLLLAQARAYLRLGNDKAHAFESHHLRNRMDRIEQENRDWKFGQDSLSQQIASLQREALEGTAALSRGLEDIRGSHTTLAQQIETLMARPPQVQPVYVQAPAPQAAAQVPQAIEVLPPQHAVEQVAHTDDDTPFGERLNLSLEPIVDLYSSQTAHYRLVASMLNDRGQEVPPEMFAHHVAQMGQRPLLDTFIVRETIPILSQLRNRDPNLCVLVPIGAATLADQAYVQTILAYLDSDLDASAGLVLDINHAVLASLPDASLEGLATLARAGVTLALSQASITGIDLAALNKLNVRYVCLAAASLALGTKTPTAVSGFVQAARALRIQTVITQVTEPHLLADIMRSARLACGPAFAAPRRLKRSAAQDEPAQFPAAA